MFFCALGTKVAPCDFVGHPSRGAAGFRDRRACREDDGSRRPSRRPRDCPDVAFGDYRGTFHGANVYASFEARSGIASGTCFYEADGNRRAAPRRHRRTWRAHVRRDGRQRPRQHRHAAERPEWGVERHVGERGRIAFWHREARADRARARRRGLRRDAAHAARSHRRPNSTRPRPRRSRSSRRSSTPRSSRSRRRQRATSARG